MRYKSVVAILACVCSLCGCSRVLHNAALVSSNPVLVRSADPSHEFLATIHNKYTLRSLVNLRGQISKEERVFLEHHPDVLLHVFHWSAIQKPPADDIDRLLALYRNPKSFPMIIHCRAGADRTGLAIALYRIEIEGMDPAEAMTEMKFYRHIHFLYPAMQSELNQRYGASSTARSLWANIKHLIKLPFTLMRNIVWDFDM
ncbi:MAG TPA: tyrosine-protein phosphatase [Candidatus Paceibacterota bacterium]